MILFPIKNWRLYMIKYTVLFILLTVELIATRTVEINLNKQRIYAKENGNIIFSAPISSGKKRHRTPNGIFRILQKNRYHYSNLYPKPYGGASMPYMQRLTNGGIAIHQGYLPGYPASHGCIRVSNYTAKRLWRWTRVGTKVKIYNKKRIYNKRRYVKKTVSKKKRRYTKKKRVFKKRLYRKDDYYTVYRF